MKKTIKDRRVELGLSLREMADAAGINLVDASAFERGLRTMRDPDAPKLAAALKWTTDELAEALPADEERTAILNAHQDRLLKAINGAAAEANKRGFRKGNGGQGEMPCPACGSGTLRFSVASINGHIWGACSSLDCVRWMQ